MNKTLLALTAFVLALGLFAPAFAHDDAAPAPTAEAAPEAAASEETPAPEAINPASGEAAPAVATSTEAPAAEAASVEPEAIEDAAQ